MAKIFFPDFPWLFLNLIFNSLTFTDFPWLSLTTYEKDMIFPDFPDCSYPAITCDHCTAMVLVDTNEKWTSEWSWFYPVETSFPRYSSLLLKLEQVRASSVNSFNPLRSKGSKSCPIFMEFGQNNHFVLIKTGFKEIFQPGPKIPISGPSSYDDSGDRAGSARIIWGQWC